MTEFEMAYLTADMQIALSTTAGILFTLTSAFLIASYYAAHRLTLTMIGILLPIYAWFFFGTTFILNRELIALFGVVGEIHAYAEAGKGLQWHAAANPAPAWVLNTGVVAHGLINLTVFAGTLFFFHCRRVNRITEMVVEAPKV